MNPHHAKGYETLCRKDLRKIYIFVLEWCSVSRIQCIMFFENNRAPDSFNNATNYKIF